MKLEKLNIKKPSTYLTFKNAVILWHQYIKSIRKKGYSRGIIGDDEDVEIVRFLLERIRKNKNRWTMPDVIQNAIDKYGKDVRQYVRKGSAARTSVIGATRVTDEQRKKLNKMAQDKGVKLSDIVYQIIATAVA